MSPGPPSRAHQHPLGMQKNYKQVSVLANSKHCQSVKDFTKTEGHRSSTCSVIQLFSIQRTFQMFKNEDTYLEEKNKK